MIRHEAEIDEFLANQRTLPEMKRLSWAEFWQQRGLPVGGE